MQRGVQGLFEGRNICKGREMKVYIVIAYEVDTHNRIYISKVYATKKAVDKYLLWLEETGALDNLEKMGIALRVEEWEVRE